MRAEGRRGSALVEVLVALVVLAVGGVALVTLLGQTGSTMRTTHEAERRTADASAILRRFEAMDRAALVAAIGRRDVAGLRAQIAEPIPDLFGVDVAESDTSPLLLRTTLYRPDSSHAAR
jgi:type II secretory pathway component PulJ